MGSNEYNTVQCMCSCTVYIQMCVCVYVFLQTDLGFFSLSHSGVRFNQKFNYRLITLINLTKG